MRTDDFRTTRPVRMLGFDAHGTASFFSLPSASTVSLVAESQIAARVQIRHDRQLYITFKRNLIPWLKPATEAATDPTAQEQAIQL